MNCYEELQARGLIAQVTDEKEIRELVNNGKATFYIGLNELIELFLSFINSRNSFNSWFTLSENL